MSRCELPTEEWEFDYGDRIELQDGTCGVVSTLFKGTRIESVLRLESASGEIEFRVINTAEVKTFARGESNSLSPGGDFDRALAYEEIAACDKSDHSPLSPCGPNYSAIGDDAGRRYFVWWYYWAD